MDHESLNANVINAIRGILPEETHLFQFLSNILPLHKEALYRRLRGDVVFTLYEIYLIAESIGLSLDYLVKPTDNKNVTFDLVLQQFQDTEEDPFTGRSRFEKILGYILADPSSKFELSHNLFPQVPTHLFYHLSKYISFKWIYKDRVGEATPFKEVEYPQEIFQTHKKNSLETMNIKNTSYIWDHTIVEMMVREIKYFEDMNLLDSEDVAILKKELHEFLNFVEEMTIKGVFPTGNRVDIYISHLNSDAAYSYMESPRFKVCIVGVFDLQYVVSTDSLAIDIMKKKITSLKKGATLITGSSDFYRIPFFCKQHELVNML